MSERRLSEIPIGTKIGRLEVIGDMFTVRRDTKNNRVMRYYPCKCECGTLLNVRNYSLLSTHAKSCGCLQKEIASKNCRINTAAGNNVIDLKDRIFGRLTVIGYSHTHKQEYFWKCLCMCGNTTNVPTNRLTSGKTKSCGCLQRDVARLNELGHEMTHGDTGTKLHLTWIGICHRAKKDNVYICEDWLNYETFKEWAIHSGYTEEMKLHRKADRLEYSPDNYKWIKKHMSDDMCSLYHRWKRMKNERSLEWETYEPFKMWALLNGYNRELVLFRTKSNQPFGPNNCIWITHKLRHQLSKVKYEYDDVPICEICNSLNLCQATIVNKLVNSNESIEEILLSLISDKLRLANNTFDITKSTCRMYLQQAVDAYQSMKSEYIND